MRVPKRDWDVSEFQQRGCEKGKSLLHMRETSLIGVLM